MSPTTIAFTDLTAAAVEAELSEEPWDLCNDASFRSSPIAEPVPVYSSHAPPEARTEVVSPLVVDEQPSPLQVRHLDSTVSATEGVNAEYAGTAEPVSPSSSVGSLTHTHVGDYEKREEKIEKTNKTPSVSSRPPISISPATQELLLDLGFTPESASPQSTLPPSFLLATANRLTRDDIQRFKEEAELNFTHSLPYFFSGSFMFPAAIHAVVNGMSLATIAKGMTPATLHGYRRAKVKGMPWPAMEAVDGKDKESSSIRGMLLFGMLEGQRKAIHRFEGGMFDLRRTKVEIELKGGEKLELDAGVYVWNGERGMLGGREEKWSIEGLLGSRWFTNVVKRAEGEESEDLLDGVEV